MSDNTTTLETSATANQQPIAPSAPVKPEFGNGRFSAQMELLYTEIQNLFGIAPDKAEKIARQAGSDAGAVLSRVNASFTVGKVSKDGKTTISDASKIKGVTVTNALMMARACQWCDEAMKNGVSYGFTKWKLSPPLQRYVDSL